MNEGRRSERLGRESAGGCAAAGCGRCSDCSARQSVVGAGTCRHGPLRLTSGWAGANNYPDGVESLGYRQAARPCQESVAAGGCRTGCAGGCGIAGRYGSSERTGPPPPASLARSRSASGAPTTSSVPGGGRRPPPRDASAAGGDVTGRSPAHTGSPGTCDDGRRGGTCRGK